MNRDLKKIEDLIVNYYIEIGVNILPSTVIERVENLIRTHRILRKEAIKSNEQKELESTKMREYIEMKLKENYDNYEYISREKLRKMSMGDFADFLSELETLREEQ